MTIQKATVLGTVAFVVLDADYGVDAELSLPGWTLTGMQRAIWPRANSAPASLSKRPESWTSNGPGARFAT